MNFIVIKGLGEKKGGKNVLTPARLGLGRCWGCNILCTEQPCCHVIERGAERNSKLVYSHIFEIMCSLCCPFSLASSRLRSTTSRSLPWYGKSYIHFNGKLISPACETGWSVDLKRAERGKGKTSRRIVYKKQGAELQGITLNRRILCKIVLDPVSWEQPIRIRLAVVLRSLIPSRLGAQCLRSTRRSELNWIANLDMFMNFLSSWLRWFSS